MLSGSASRSLRSPQQGSAEGGGPAQRRSYGKCFVAFFLESSPEPAAMPPGTPVHQAFWNRPRLLQDVESSYLGMTSEPQWGGPPGRMLHVSPHLLVKCSASQSQTLGHRLAPGPWESLLGYHSHPLAHRLFLEPSGPGCLKFVELKTFTVCTCVQAYVHRGEAQMWEPCPLHTGPDSKLVPNLSEQRTGHMHVSTPKGKVASSHSPPPALIWSNYSCSYSLKKVCYWH